MATIGFIGAGNMAEAIARGIIASGVYPANQIFAVDTNDDRRKLFTDMGVTCEGSGGTKASQADVVIMAVKPFVMGDVLTSIAPNVKSDALVISIAAGISCAFIEKTLGGNGRGRRVIRVMPNTPMLAGKGMSAIARGTHATAADEATTQKIFGAAGKVVLVSEPQIDAVTAISGSGPAYIFYVTEVLAQAGESVGLSKEQAADLARETVIGAAALLAQSPDSPAELRRKVTTPNGTTQAAIESMQADNLAALMSKAAHAAAKRSKELGK